MSLTIDDLQAIRTIVEDVVGQSDRDTAAGFAEVHQKIDGMQLDITDLKSDVGTLKSDVGTLKSDVHTLKSDVNTLKSDVHTLKSDVNALKADMVLVKQELGDVKTTVDRIDRVQRAEVTRLDRQESSLMKMRQAFKKI